MEIRKARPDDLCDLVQGLGQRRFFIDRFHRQQSGRGELITAWSARRAVGAVYLWLEDAEEPKIRHHLPGAPLLTHLEVAPSHRNNGVGTSLIEATELRAVELGHNLLALAVRQGNQLAERFYHPLGYTDWMHGPVECIDRFGNLDVEVCDVLIKTLGWTGVPQQRGELHAAHSLSYTRYNP